MKLGRALGGVGGAVAGIGAANAALRKRAGSLEPPLGEDPYTHRWRGIDVSITEAGDPDDPDVLLLHGLDVTATSREFRQVFQELAADHHVIAPDFPGFGRSERPPLVYSARFYEDFVRELAREVADRPICVASSLSGAYAAAAARDAEFEQLVLIAPTDTTTGRDHWLGRTAIRLPLVGTGVFNALVTRPAIRFRWQRAVTDPSAVSREDLAYYWRSAHQPGAKYAPASLLSGMLDPDLDLETVLSGIDIPTSLVWGRQARDPPLRDGRRLAEGADCTLVVIDRSKTHPHVDQPAAFRDVLDETLATAQH